MAMRDLWFLVISSVNDALNLDWSEITYKKSSWVIWAAAFVVAAFFVSRAVAWRKKKSGSHYNVSMRVEKRHRPGFARKLARGLAWCLALASLFFLGVALADPVFYVTDKVEQIESREIVYVRDVSASNGFRIQNTDVSRGELAQEVVERLVIKRKDKKDRAAYVVFGTYSEIWSGFTTSFESLIFSISRAPRAVAPAEARENWPGMFILNKGQFVESFDGGSTNLHLGLESAIYLFDRKGSPKVTEELKRNPNAKMRSIVIITDGAAEVDPEPQFLELRKRRIIPHLIFVDPDRTIEKQIHGENSIKAKLPDQLLMKVRRSGGQYFMARDKESVDRISEELDRLQSVKQIQLTNVREKDVYYIPLAVAFLLAIAAIAMRIIFALTWRTV